MILSLMKYYHGYLLVRLTGFAPERFINLCSNHNILIWDLKYVDGAYEFLITVKGYRQIKPFLRKSKTKLKILKKFGLPFFLYQNRNRKVFFGGILLFFLLLNSMSLFIWDIHIEGNYTYTEDVLLTYLKEQNVQHGMVKFFVDTEEVKSLLRNEYSEITWVSAQVSGTRLLIQVKENYGLLTIPEKNEDPCDLVATKDAIITEIVTRSGVPLVKAGDIVSAGQVIVSGQVPIMNDAAELVAEQYVHSDATIKAKTVYDYSDSFSLLHTIKSYTGKVKKGFYLRFFNYTIQTNPLRINYESYDIVKEEYQLKVLSNFYLPFYAGSVRYEEYLGYDSYYSEKEAFALAAKRLHEMTEVLAEQGIVIEERQVQAEIKNGICTSQGFLKIIEEFGEESYFDVAEQMRLWEESETTEETEGF